MSLILLTYSVVHDDSNFIVTVLFCRNRESIDQRRKQHRLRYEEDRREKTVSVRKPVIVVLVIVVDLPTSLITSSSLIRNGQQNV